MKLGRAHNSCCGVEGAKSNGDVAVDGGRMPGFGSRKDFQGCPLVLC